MDATTTPTYLGADLGAKGFIATYKNQGHASKKYIVKRPDGQSWPEDRALINFCDHGPCNWGGKVWSCGDTAEVTVYID